VPTLGLPPHLERARAVWRAAVEDDSAAQRSLAPDAALLRESVQLLQQKIPTADVIARSEALAPGIKGVHITVRDRVAALRLVSRGLRLARNYLTLPPDFVNEFFALHVPGTFGAREVARIVAEVATHPPGAPPRALGDVFVFFLVQLPDRVNDAFFAWMSRPVDTMAASDKLRTSLTRFCENAPAALNLSTTVTWLATPTNEQEYTRGIKDFVAGNLEKSAAQCFTCGARDITLLKCSRCSGARYCGRDCQRKDWKRHQVHECADMTALLFWKGQVGA
jgi:hypothetical protein